MNLCRAALLQCILSGLVGNSEAAPLSKIAIINTATFHYEVYPALFYVWKLAGYDVRTFAHNESRQFQIEGVTKNMNFEAKYLFNGYTGYPDEWCRYDAIVLASAEWEVALLKVLKRHIIQANCGYKQPGIVLVYHGCESCLLDHEVPHLFAKYLKFFPRAYVITLGPQAANATARLLEASGITNRQVDYIIPLFPIDSKHPVEHTGFVLQVNLNGWYIPLF